MLKTEITKRLLSIVNKAAVIPMLFTILAGALPPVGIAAAENASPNTLVIEDFENNLSDVKLIQKRNFSGAMSLESDPKHVRSGKNSVRIDYDYIGVKENPSYVYVGPAAGSIPITGNPKKMGMWVYGNNDGHQIFSKFRDGSGKSFEVEYLDENIGVNWYGWKYIEGKIPEGKVGPIVLDIYMRIEQSIFDKKNKGTVWVDDVRLIYEDTPNEDMEIPTLNVVAPGNNTNVETNRPLIQLLTADAQSGIDPNSIQVDINGHSVKAAYDAPKGVIQYQSAAPMAGGYHTVHAAVYDRSGNPAEINSTFFIRDGVQYQIEAPSEVISNKTFPLKLQVKNADQLKGSYAKLSFDPQTLEITSAESKIAESLVTQNKIDNVKGEYQFELQGLNNHSLSADGTLALLTFKVKPTAKMERGELFKSIGINDGSFQFTVGEAVYASVRPHTYKIGFPYVLTIKGSSLHSKSTMRVTDDVGVPVEGASIALPNPLNPQFYAKVNVTQSGIYASANLTSAKLASVSLGEQFFSSGVKSAGFIAVHLPDGKGTGWIPSGDVESGLSTDKWGKTDANGEIHTNLTTLALMSLGLQAVNGDKVSKVVILPIVPQLGADEPEFIRTFVTEDLKTTQSIVWRTAPRVEQGVIQYVKDSDFKTFDQPNIVEQATVSELVLAPDSTGEALFHKGLLKGLTPGTAYRYRVGYPGHWSASHIFKTEAASPDSFSFLFVTDSHTNNEEGFRIHQDLMKSAISNFPNTRFVMHGGDIVDDGGIMYQWEQDMKASEIYSASIPSAYALGNHDVKNGGKQVFMNALGLPNNGMKTQEHLTYSYDYEDTHVVVLNSEADEVDMKQQAIWLRENLNASKKKWTVAMFHRPAYHTEDGRGPELVTYYLAPVLEELGVDLVLVGHDHALAWTYPMKNGKPLKDGSKGTIYLVGGSSGWKFYDAVKHDYLNYLYDDNFPVYSAITINKDHIAVEARTTDGKQLQAMTIEKPKNPSPDPGSKPDTNPSPNQGSGSAETKPSKERNSSGLLTRQIKEQDLIKQIEEGKLEFELDPQGEEISLPSHISQLLKDKPLVFNIGKIKVSLNPQALKLADTNQKNASQIVLTIDRNQAAKIAKIKAAQSFTNAALSPAGDLITLSLDVLSTDGTKTIVKTDETVSISLSMESSTNKSLVGFYALKQDGSAHFVTSKKTNTSMNAQVSPNGQYVLLEYTRTYADVAKEHWAASIIKELSAQHIIEGIDDTHFAPEQVVTRAEFVAMLVRKLGLQATSKSNFSDVAPTNWYAEAVTAAQDAGIVNGTSANKFGPNDTISRQEMATIVIRAYEYLHGKLALDGQYDFKDMINADEWALESLQKAKKLGLMSGYVEGDVRPLEKATRAESAKLINMTN
ncbi:hypothetical protein GK047_16280 [Paenibacillus sp. SYP-B3998]|uniref:SLH domain-containing protein n=1 Tax=Paenibacillus sp. SYP-B3998 TaxID=2678564 RepID=A0A6G3ZZM8_9BACL|nr:S-layer homology domain-containing protein [Paenibacillus sp. SYP-B3998]NEW07565.1 hypothetical protein [Paenibacillus sp. SYP-B3998]